MNVKKDAVQKLEIFKEKPKFEIEKSGQFYQGLSKLDLKPILTKFLNTSADEFISVVKNHPTEKEFQNQIKIGLKRFNPYYLELDTEDREKVCYYYQELMDCVGLNSSDGILNDWMYNFDPSAKN